MTVAIAFILVLTLMQTLLLAYVLLYDRQWRIDARRIGAQMASNILSEYEGQVDTLNGDGTRRLVRERYLQLCAAFGLPETAVESVVGEAWALIALAQGDESPGVALYE